MTDIVRPDSLKENVALASYNAEIQRAEAIKMFMGPATSPTQMRLSWGNTRVHSLVEGAKMLGYNLPAISKVIEMARADSPGHEGAGRTEITKILCSHPTSGYPSTMFPEQGGPGLIAKLLAFFTGKKPAGEQQTP